MIPVYKQILCFVQYLVENIGLLRWPGNSVSMTAYCWQRPFQKWTATSMVGTEPTLTTIVRLPQSGQLRMHTKPLSGPWGKFTSACLQCVEQTLQNQSHQAISCPQRTFTYHKELKIHILTQTPSSIMRSIKPQSASFLSIKEYSSISWLLSRARPAKHYDLYGRYPNSLFVVCFLLYSTKRI